LEENYGQVSPQHPQQSSFLAGNIDDENKIKDAQAMAAKINLPSDKWMKLYAKCHHCGEKGHICPQCPDYSRKSSRARSRAQMEAIAQAIAVCLLHVLPIMHPPYVATVS
jgi:hypothetical protein